jgi:hypothetical protein
MASAGTIYLDVKPNLSACKQATRGEIVQILAAHIYGDSANQTGDLSICTRMADDLLNRYAMLPRADA